MANADQNLPSSAVHGYHKPHHALQLTKCNTLYECNGCRRIASGFIYRCEPCNFNLHVHCMFLKNNAQHPFFPGYTFDFLKELPEKCHTKNCTDCNKHCRACTREADGYVYRCKEKDINLHPSCFNLPSKLQLPQIKGVEFELSSKEGPLPQKCVKCRKKWLDGAVTGYEWWFYKSTCEKDYCHAYCSIKMFLEACVEGDSSDTKKWGHSSLKGKGMFRFF